MTWLGVKVSLHPRPGHLARCITHFPLFPVYGPQEPLRHLYGHQDPPADQGVPQKGNGPHDPHPGPHICAAELGEFDLADPFQPVGAGVRPDRVPGVRSRGCRRHFAVTVPQRSWR